jgi:glycosyltransferase involved in cell wall biosynthesis
MTKILFLIPSLAKGGAERLVLDICNEFQKRSDFQVKLITFHSKNEYQFLTSELDYSVVPSSYSPSLKGKTIVKVNELQSEINQFQPDIIHSHLFETEMVLSAISYNNCKYLVHFHDNMKQFKKFKFHSLKSKEALTNYFERKLVLKSYKKKNVSFIAIAKDSLRFIKDNLPKKYKSKLVHNAINLDRFSNSGKEKDVNKLVIIGSLVDKKGQDLAIDVINELHKRNCKVYLDVLGEGPNRNTLEMKVRDYKLEHYISFHGNMDYPEHFLSNAKIYLHTAIYEPFGLVLIEAMASGLPIVCTDAKGNRDIIVEGENGFLINERSVQKLADKIELLINDPVLYHNITKSSFELSKKYNIINYVDELVKIYKSK